MLKNSEKIKLIRNYLGISQEELARELCVSFATVNRWENDKTSPSKMALKLINEFCKRKNISPDILDEAICETNNHCEVKK